MPNTVRLHRVLAAKPEKVYRAFIEADALAKWLPPNGFACTVHQLDAKVGGAHRISFRSFVFAGAPGSTAPTPSGLMLKAKNVNGSSPGFPHWCTRPNGS
jgi:hypothetical protein